MQCFLNLHLCFCCAGIDDLRTTIYDAASALKKTGLGQVSVMGEKIPHSFRLVADAILAKRQELHKIGRSPIMHKTEFEALVLDIIKNDPIDIEDANDLIDVTQFMHERGRSSTSDDVLFVRLRFPTEYIPNPFRLKCG